MTVRSNVYRAGVPTDIDINKIREAYPDSTLKAGDVIGYDEIEDLLDIGRNSNRFKTVTLRWRTMVEKESAIIIGTKRSVGFKVLNNVETFNASSAKFVGAIRSTIRSQILSGYVVRRDLDTNQKKHFDFVQSKVGAIIAIANLKRKPRLPRL